MADDVQAVIERLERLEATVATGAVELRAEIASCESRLRVLIEDGREKTRAGFEAVGAAFERLEAEIREMRLESQRDRAERDRVFGNHERRITALERKRPAPRSRS